MKNKAEQLQNRGYLEEGDISEFQNISFEEKVKLIQSKKSVERTLGARILKENKTKTTVDHLINALKKETKLYTKLEICNTLSELNDISIEPLIQCLGEIGNNQHKEIPKKDFKKDSYPLPRDISGRTLIRIGKRAIPPLINELKTSNKKRLSELIDAIGHINFYSKSKEIFEPLQRSYSIHKNNDLIKWKIIRAMSGVNESESFLLYQLRYIRNDRIKQEIHRSLRLIKNRKH